MPLFRNQFKSSRFARCAQAVLMAAVVCFSLGATDPQAHFNEVGHKLMCPCGCAQMLLECNHVGCPDSGPMRDDISNGIANGLSDAAIVDRFVKLYGSTVLAAPTTQGFDLVAWIMPFAVAAGGLIGTIFLVRHWSKHETGQQAALASTGKPKSAAQIRAEEAMRERVRRETGTDGGL